MLGLNVNLNVRFELECIYLNKNDTLNLIKNVYLNKNDTLNLIKNDNVCIIEVRYEWVF
jgi:hypothetical protein